MVQTYQSPVRVYKYPFEIVMAVSLFFGRVEFFFLGQCCFTLIFVLLFLFVTKYGMR